MKVEPGNILKLFLNVCNFEPQYSYRLYSYKKKSVANVKESFAQCEEYNFRTGTKISANHLASSCWEEPIIDKIGLSGMFSLCVLGKPYIRGSCESVGRTLS